MTLVLICPLKSEPRCAFGESKNITEGSIAENDKILFENVAYSPDLYFITEHVDIGKWDKQLVEPHIRGCVCLIKVCLKLCHGLDDEDILLPTAINEIVDLKQLDKFELLLKDPSQDPISNLGSSWYFRIEDGYIFDQKTLEFHEPNKYCIGNNGTININRFEFEWYPQANLNAWLNICYCKNESCPILVNTTEFSTGGVYEIVNLANMSSRYELNYNYECTDLRPIDKGMIWYFKKKGAVIIPSVPITYFPGDFCFYNPPGSELSSILYCHRLLCPPGEKVDISDGKYFANGTIFHENILYSPENHAKESSEPENDGVQTFGCICNKKICIRVDCPYYENCVDTTYPEIWVFSDFSDDMINLRQVDGFHLIPHYYYGHCLSEMVVLEGTQWQFMQVRIFWYI